MSFRRFHQKQAIFHHVSASVSGRSYWTNTPFLRADLLPITLPLTLSRQEGRRAAQQQVQVLSLLYSLFAYFWPVPPHQHSATGAMSDEQQR